MAIQMRRGYRKDFDPTKMLPGEWAVSIDATTSNQIVWMCFGAGIVKRMGTWEDLEAELDPYKEACQSYSDSAKDSSDKASVSETNAKKSETNAKVSETNAKASEDKAKQYKDEAFSGTPEGYQALLDNVESIENNITYYEQNGYLSRNIYDESKYPFTNNYYINTNGETTVSSSSSYKATFGYIPIKPSVQITFSGKGFAGLDISFYDVNKSHISHSTSKTVITPNNSAYMRFSCGKASENIQIEYGEIEHPYTTYCPPNTEITTNSNAILDVKMLGWSVPKDCPIQNSVSGNVFTQKVGRVDLGSLDWKYTTGERSRMTATTQSPCKASDYNDIANGICGAYNIVSANDVYGHKVDKGISIRVSVIWLYDPSYTDATEFKNAMKGKYFYYELATPITMTIDGNEILAKIMSQLATLQAMVLELETES